MNRRWLLGAGLASAGLVGVGAWLTRLPPAPPPRPARPTSSGAYVYYSPGYRVSFFGIERLHPFDIGKYDRIVGELGSRGVLSSDEIGIGEAPDVDALAAVHDRDYLASLRDAATLAQALEVPVPTWVPGGVLDRRVLAAMRRVVGGTVAATRDALGASALAINLGGGYHHARPALGHGFCVYNDVALALHTARSEGFAGSVLIVDTDAHQGDGNHAFFATDPAVYCFSMHQRGIFPQPPIPGDRDLEVDRGIGDDAFLELLDHALTEILDQHSPDLVFHVAGADILGDDPLAGLALTPEGLARRDALVRARVGDRPLVHLLAGGYGPSAASAQALSLAGLLSR